MKLKLKMEPELGQIDGSGSSQIPPAPGGSGSETLLSANLT